MPARAWRRLTNSRLALAGTVVFLVAGGLYLRTLAHGFAWDDLSILMANTALDDWSQLGSNLAPGFFHESSDPQLRDYWRPAVVLSHMVDRQLFGYSAWGPHLVNALLHATTSTLVLLLCNVWSQRVRWALVAGLVFAVHPVHVEVVAWVSGRSDLVCGLFLALALWADANHGRTARTPWQVLCLGSFALALLSKEAAIVFPALILARTLLAPNEWRARQRGRSQALASVTASFAVLFLVLWMRFGLLGASAPEGIAASADRSSLFWTWWSAFWLYLELLVWPMKLTILHQVEIVRTLWEPRVLAGSAAFLGLGLACWRVRRRAPTAAFGIVVLLVSLAPLSNFLIRVSRQGGSEFPAAERFLYAPSIGFSLLAAWLLAVWLPGILRRFTASSGRDEAGTPRTRNRAPEWAELISISLALLLVLAMGVRSDARIRDWRSDLTLFEATVADSPESHLAHLNYAAALVAANNESVDPTTRWATLDSARRHYLEAAEISPGNYRVHYDLANLYRTTGMQREAENSYRQALRLNPGLHQARINLGTLLAESGNLEGALDQFEAADRLRPRLVAAKVNSAHVLQMLGRPEEAIPLYEEALALDPKLLAARDGLARAQDAASSSKVE